MCILRGRYIDGYYKDNNVTIPNKNKTFTSLLKDESFLESSLTNIKKQKKEGGSEIVSLFEKDYFMSNSDNLYTIKKSYHIEWCASRQVDNWKI